MNKLLLRLTIPMLLVGSTVEAKVTEKFEFSGFARIVGGYLDESDASYEGYDNSLSFSEQSLLALQGDYYATDKLSFSAQLLAHTDDRRESGVEWLYATYEPNQNWRFKIGKLRTPFFVYSDVKDVGFAYHWITPPQQIYSAYLFSTYEGVAGAYRFDINELHFDFEAYWGSFEDKTDYLGRDVTLNVDGIGGAFLQMNADGFTARLSYLKATDFSAQVPELDQFRQVLEAAGFQESADSLVIENNAEAFHASVGYETLEYFLSAEIITISSELLIVPNIRSYYLTAGYNFDMFQAHITFASSDADYDAVNNTIPKGLSPQLDQLSFGYDAIINNLPVDTLDSITVGARWDIKYNLAAKVEVTFLDGEPDATSFFVIDDNSSFDRKATLYQVALEWVF